MALKLIKRNHDMPDKYERFDAEKLAGLKGPIVFCMSGNFASDEKKINNYFQMTEDLLGITAKQSGKGADFSKLVHLVGTIYSDRGNLEFGEYKELMSTLLMSRCVRDGSNLPVDEICKNLSQITFFTYCRGATVATNLMEKFGDALKDRGFSEADIDKIYSSMLHITFAPEIDGKHDSTPDPTVKPLPRSRYEKMPSIRIKSFNDFIINSDRSHGLKGRLQADYEEIYGKLDGVAVKFNDPANMIKKDNVTIFTSNLIEGNTEKVPQNEHCISILKRRAIESRDAKGEPNGWRLFGKFVHDKTQEVVKVEDENRNADLVSQGLAYALAENIVHGINNQHSDHYIPRDMKRVYTNLQSVCQVSEPDFEIN